MYPEIDFLVGIHCITYNQSSYITDALNGFTMQQTNFPFVAVIIDDASTDGEHEVIRKYVDEHFDHSTESEFREWETEDAHWSHARHRDNKNCYFVVVYLKKNHFKEPDKKMALVHEWMNVKYLASCEGDDYWIDSHKLQKQVAFMECHPEYAICYHHVKILNIATGEFEKDDETYMGIPEDFSIKELSIRNCIYTNSVLYRNNIIALEKVQKLGTTIIKDYASHLFFSEYGLIKRLPDVMGVYRKGVGIWSKNRSFLYNNIESIECISKISVLIEDQNAKKIIEKQVDYIKTNTLQLADSTLDQVHDLMSSNEYRIGQMITKRFHLISNIIIKIGNRKKQNKKKACKPFQMVR